MANKLGLNADQGLAIDAKDPYLAQRLVDLNVNSVVHTAGPFQGQGYAVARAAISAGSNYIDLADGRDFVSGITELDELARQRGVFVTSGASSLPALSSAVVDRYVERFSRLTSIRHGIGSGARAPGLATMRGVFGYCGKRFLRFESGNWITVHGWLDTQRHRFPISQWLEPFVSDKGGMFVSMQGYDIDGKLLKLTWHLIAGSNHGPYIPCGASIALATKLARGKLLPHGAQPCMGMISVEDYLAALNGLDVHEVPA
jgi:hypothetical protein